MIEVRGLTYSYPGEKKPAVDNIDFRIHKGEIFGFLGPSGAGKSTTQKILTGLLVGWKGSIKIDGRDLKGLGKEYNQNIGVAFEFPHFYQKFTAIENLEFFGSLYNKIAAGGQGELKHRIQNLLETVGLGEEGEKKAGEYSKGMKMRLNLCRALVHTPELLYLDEPTSGLDPANSRNIRKIIKAEAETGKTVFLTTHNMEVAREVCDRVAFLNNGRLAVVDTPRNLMLKYGSQDVRIEYNNPEGNPLSEEFPLEGLGKNKDFINCLTQKKITTIHSREATLEDVFIKLTGRGLE